MPPATRPATLLHPVLPGEICGRHWLQPRRLTRLSTWWQANDGWNIIIPHRIRMYAIYGLPFTINIPQMLTYIPYIRILWVLYRTFHVGHHRGNEWKWCLDSSKWWKIRKHAETWGTWENMKINDRKRTWHFVFQVPSKTTSDTGKKTIENSPFHNSPTLLFSAFISRAACHISPMHQK